MIKGVKYISYSNTTGYGLTGVAYVRALVNAGVPVWWQPTFYAPFGVVSWTPMQSAHVLDIFRQASCDETLGDVPALLNATTRPIDCDVQVVHMVPEYWSHLFEPGKRHVGYTMWETDRLPDAWPAWLNLAQRIIVPDQGSRQRFAAGNVNADLHVVPHIRRHVWNRFSRQDIAQARQLWNVHEGHFVFYSISTWDPSKAWPDLIRAYLAEFRADEPVVLLIKTSAEGPDPHTTQRHSTEALVADILNTYARESGRSDLPTLSLLAINDMPGSDIDLIHTLGDCYVSLSHGECFGLGAFDAATLGKPVVMTGWGGQTDFLGTDNPGLVRWRFEPVTSWPGYETYSPPQQWAQCDAEHARKLMRWAFEQRDEARAHAATRRLAIYERYAEPVIARQLIQALS